MFFKKRKYRLFILEKHIYTYIKRPVVIMIPIPPACLLTYFFPVPLTWWIVKLTLIPWESHRIQCPMGFPKKCQPLLCSPLLISAWGLRIAATSIKHLNLRPNWRQSGCIVGKVGNRWKKKMITHWLCCIDFDPIFKNCHVSDNVVGVQC